MTYSCNVQQRNVIRQRYKNLLHNRFTTSLFPDTLWLDSPSYSKRINYWAGRHSHSAFNVTFFSLHLSTTYTEVHMVNQFFKQMVTQYLQIQNDYTLLFLYFTVHMHNNFTSFSAKQPLQLIHHSQINNGQSTTHPNNLHSTAFFILDFIYHLS